MSKVRPAVVWPRELMRVHNNELHYPNTEKLAGISPFFQRAIISV